MTNQISHADPEGDATQLVIVALPRNDDVVWKISSEQVPHLTLLHLGNPKLDSSQIGLITSYVEHASSLLPVFSLPVDSRGELGPNKADVLFFNQKRSRKIEDFRQQLLRNNLISEAYLSTVQFAQWTPHLTLGYPGSPAKNDQQYDFTYSYVTFDRIAVWTGNYSGPTFQLQEEFDMEVAMSQIERGRSAMDGILSHHGVKGMKWGVRRSQAQLDAASHRPPSHPASADAASAAKAINKASEGGLHVLSNQELQQAITRMNLESQYRNLTTAAHQSELDRGLLATQKILKLGKTAEDVRKFLNTPTGKILKKSMTGAFAAAAAYSTGGASAAAGAGASVVLRRPKNHYTNVGN